MRTKLWSQKLQDLNVDGMIIIKIYFKIMGRKNVEAVQLTQNGD
jgi:hypothetical protein